MAEFGQKLLSERAISLIKEGDKEKLFSELSKIVGKKVIKAMWAVPREKFIPTEYFELSYDDSPYPINSSNGKSSISQPSTVALMTHYLNVRKTDVVLEIGGATGYQAAILGKLARKVVSVEILPGMVEKASERVRGLGIRNVDFVTADGTLPFTENRKFDRILVTASVFPHAGAMTFLNSLKTGGVCIVPIGGDGGNPEWCKLTKIRKTEQGFKIEKYKPNYSFVLAEGGKGWEKMGNHMFYSFHSHFFGNKD